jgi:hypothetical protein
MAKANVDAGGGGAGGSYVPAAPSGGGGGGGGGSGPPTPQSLASQASSEVGIQIGNEEAPYRTQIGDAQAAMANALSGLDKMFGNILPYVQSSAQRVGDFYNAGLAEEKAVWSTATARLDQLRSQRAAEAQAMAQQTGGPVPLDAFTSPLNTSLAEMPHAQAGGILRSMGLAQGGVQEAQAFAGRVFPLLQTEQHEQIRMQFQQRINDLQDEINRIEAQKTERTQTRLDELQQQERDYKLEQDKLALQKLQAQRDWLNDQETQRQNRLRLANERANLLGYTEGRYRDAQGRIHTWRKPTLAATQTGLDAQQKAAALAEDVRSHQAGEALTDRQITVSAVNKTAALRQNQQVMQQNYRDTAAKYMDAVQNPGTETVTQTKYFIVPPGQYQNLTTAQQGATISRQLTAAEASAALGRPAAAGVYHFQVKSTTEAISHPVIQNPTDMYQFLVGKAIPRPIAAEMVRRRFGLPADWKPGSAAQKTYTPQAIDQMKFNDLRLLAVQRGWKPDPAHPATANTLKTWLKNHGILNPTTANNQYGPTITPAQKAAAANATSTQKTIPQGTRQGGLGKPVVTQSDPRKLPAPESGFHWVRIGRNRYQQQVAQ